MNQSQILVVDDDSQLREAIVDTLMLTGYACIEASSGEEALSLLLRRHVDMVISDIQMDGMDGHSLLNNIHEQYPQLPVLLMTAYANIDGAVKAMRDGAIDYLSKPFAPEVLLNQVSRYVPVKRITRGEPIWADPSTGELLKLACKVAASDATVMITGPSGSGKEVLSRYVHDNSPRANGPFIAINCAAIPDTMLESTLFGYEKGAFTGAVQACPGKFEQAQGGTILLDEITEMDLNLQSKLLRVLQEKEVERLGGRKTISLDVRVIATSNRDLKQAVAEKVFREDLYYRLNVFPLKWRPLAQRIKDVLPLAQFFLQRHATENARAIPELSKEAIERLESYTWPGNVRELQNVIQRALILCDGSKVEAKDLILDESDVIDSSDSVTAGISPELKQEQELMNNSVNNNVPHAAANGQGATTVNNNAFVANGALNNNAPTNSGFVHDGGIQMNAANNNLAANNGNMMGMPNMPLNNAYAQGANNAVPFNGAMQGNAMPSNAMPNSAMPNTAYPPFDNFNGQAPIPNQPFAAVSPNNNNGANSGFNQSPFDTARQSSDSTINMLRNQKIPTNLGGELKQQEYQIILDALIEYRGNRTAVSERLGISPRTLRYKIAKMREEGMIIPG